MKKLLALLMSVSMITSLFTAMAITSYAASVGTTETIVVSPSSVTYGYAVFDVATTTTMDFAINEKAINPTVPAMGTKKYYSGSGVAAATLKFKFNSEYFDLSSDSGVFILNTDELASVQTNTNDNGYVTVSFAGSAADSTAKTPLYQIWVLLKDTSKTVNDLKDMKCITDVYDYCDLTIYTFTAETDATSAAVKSSYSRNNGTLLFDCPDEDKDTTVKVTDITLDTDTINAQEEATGTVTAAVVPDNATTKGVNFKSNDTSVITIDADGKWTAVGAGETTITVTPKEEGSTVSKTINVTVTAKPASVASLTAGNAAVSEEVANTGYWIYKLSNFTGDRAVYELTFTDKTADESLKYTSGMSLTSEGDVSFALYLTASANRLGHTFATSAQVGTLSAPGADLIIGTAAE